MTFKIPTSAPLSSESAQSACTQCAQQRFCSWGRAAAKPTPRAADEFFGGDLEVSESVLQAALPQVVAALYGIPLLVLVLVVIGLSHWELTAGLSLAVLVSVMAMSMGVIVAIGRRWPVLRYEHLLKEKL